ncbi:MAG: sulfurtransferase [Hydrogenophilales bacterium]|nr:sulfurtransferase [Hydrogenophilales bacterium]
MERSIKAQDLKSNLNGVTLIDVRRKADLDADTSKLPGAAWHDPEQIEAWAAQLPKGKEVVLYCVRGGSVSNSVLDTLRGKGVKARFIEGGIVGWKEAGGEVVAK